MILASLLVLLQQTPTTPAPITPAQATPAQAAPQRLGVDFDKNGWPLAGRGRAKADAGKSPTGATAAGAADPARPWLRQPIGAVPAGEIAAGAGAWSRVLGTVGSAEAFRALGYLRIQWRVRVVGADGATIGERLVRQLTDAGGSDRERLEFDDGRVYARLDGNVQAERHAMPWPTLEAAAARELAIFSLHAGLPWRLVDPARHVDRGMPRVAAGDGTITLVVAPRPEQDPVGPPVESACAQTIELVVDAATLTPREVVTSADAPKDRRRVLLEDWRPWNGLQLPFRRTWLDADGRPATVLELVEAEAGFRTTDKEFRLR